MLRKTLFENRVFFCFFSAAHCAKDSARIVATPICNLFVLIPFLQDFF